MPTKNKTHSHDTEPFMYTINSGMVRGCNVKQESASFTLSFFGKDDNILMNYTYDLSTPSEPKFDLILPSRSYHRRRYILDQVLEIINNPHFRDTIVAPTDAVSKLAQSTFDAGALEVNNIIGASFSKLVFLASQTVKNVEHCAAQLSNLLPINTVPEEAVTSLIELIHKKDIEQRSL